MNRANLILLIVVLGLASFYVWGKKHKLDVQQQQTEAKRYFPGETEASVIDISVTSTDPKFAYTLHRISDQWYLDGHLASQEKSPQLVHSLIELGTEKEVAAQATAELDREYGLDQPSYVIRLLGLSKKKLGAVFLGKRTPGGNHYYGRLESGGPIATVPAYTLSPLEEEPKNLTETSPFPVEVAAIDRFELKVGDAVVRFERPKGKDVGFNFTLPEARPADETKVTALIFKLKNKKIARLLGADEKPPLGRAEATYRAHYTEAKTDFVVEFCQPVPANPKLYYGRRYLTPAGEHTPIVGTQEIFVIELGRNEDLLHPQGQDFEDRRLARLDVDKVQRVRLARGEDHLVFERLPQGGWRFLEPDSRRDEVVPDTLVDKLLWSLRDLRAQDLTGKPWVAQDSEVQIELITEEKTPFVYRLATDKSGKPFVGFGDKGFLVEAGLASALDEAVKAMWERSEAATPTPAATP